MSGSLLSFYVDDVIQIDSVWVSRAVSAQYAAGAFGQIVSGLLADVFGHRRVLTILMLANAVLLNFQGRVQSATSLLLVRLLTGFVTPYALALTWVAEASTAAHLARNMSLAVLLAQVTVGVGSAIAGQLDGSDFATACLLVSALPAANFVLLVGSRDLKDTTAPHSTGGTVFKDLLATLRVGALQAVTWGIFAHGCFLGLALSIVPVALKDMHGRPAADVSMVFTIGGVLTVCCHAFLTPRITKLFPARGVWVLSTILAALLVALGILITENAIATMVIAAVGYACNFMCLGCSNFLVVVAAKRFGPLGIAAVNGVARCVFTLGAAAAPAVADTLQEAAGDYVPPCVLAVLFLSVVVAVCHTRASQVLDISLIVERPCPDGSCNTNTNEREPPVACIVGARTAGKSDIVLI